MLRMMLMTLGMLSLTGLTACGDRSAPNGLSGFCEGLAPLADAHTVALLEDGGDRSVVTGNRLLGGIDAGCLASVGRPAVR